MRYLILLSFIVSVFALGVLVFGEDRVFKIDDLVEAPFGRTFLSPDSFFTNHQVTFKDFLYVFTNFTNNKFTYEQKHWIYHCSTNFKLSPYVALIRLEQEANLTWNTCDNADSNYEQRMNRAMGYALHLTDDPNNSMFSNQVFYAMRTFRLHYDSWKPGLQVKWQKSHLDQAPCVPRNAASWALYSYSPAFGKCFYPWHNNCVEYGNAIWCIVQRKMFEVLLTHEQNYSFVKPVVFWVMYFCN